MSDPSIKEYNQALEELSETLAFLIQDIAQREGVKPSDVVEVMTMKAPREYRRDIQLAR